MALVTTGIKRVFKMEKDKKEIVLDDPNIEFSPEEVLSFYSNVHPELTTATVSAPELIDDEQVYKFKSTLGTKG